MLQGGEGDALPVVVKTITQKQLKEYAEASGDRNPLHLDPEFAATTQFGGIIAHGMLTLAFVSEIMASRFGRAWLETGSLKVRFQGAAYLGDHVDAWGHVSREELGPDGRRVICSVGVWNRKTGQQLVRGTATVKLK